MSTSQTRVKREKAFSMQEDEALCIAWLTISQDPVTGGAQKDSCFWNRVFQDFSKNTVGIETRTVCSIQNRWDKIEFYCTKYRGCLAQIKHRHQSGYGIADQDNQAKSLYQNDIGEPFIYEHCWELLKSCVKWVIVGAPSSVSSPRGKSKRLLEQKAEKDARRKNKASPQDSGILDTIDKIFERRELRKTLFEEKKLQIMQNRAELEATKLQIMWATEEKKRAIEEKKKVAEDREQQSQDNAIMNLDTSSMSSDLQQYYQMRKNAIVAKALKFSTSSNFSVDSLPNY